MVLLLEKWIWLDEEHRAWGMGHRARSQLAADSMQQAAFSTMH